MNKPSPQRQYRWKICALLFFACTINYVDRQVLGIVAPAVQLKYSISESEYGIIVGVFQGAYAFGLLLSSFFLDKVGSRMGLGVAVIF